MSKATRKHTRQWMLMVMGRQHAFMGDDAEVNAEAAVSISIDAFIAKFPAQILCAASIDAVAASVRFWNEGAVMAALDNWRQANEPSGPALPAQAEAAPVSRDAKVWLGAFYRAENDRQAERALDLIRGHSDEAWAYLCRHDMRAADIAVARRWYVPRSRAELSDEWDDEQGIRERVRRLGELRTATQQPYNPRYRGAHEWPAVVWSVAAKMLTEAVRRHAPQHAWALVEELKALQTGRPVDAPPPPMVITQSLFGD